jgi:acyl-CoA reductase-like NAD-dependent aldehyde dehydrogenase
MSTTMTIEVRDEAYQAIRGTAIRTGRAPEAVAQEWVERVAKQRRATPASSYTSPDRRAFLQLTQVERRRILAEQAEHLRDHYEQDSEWRDLEAGDLVEY